MMSEVRGSLSTTTAVWFAVQLEGTRWRKFSQFMEVVNSSGQNQWNMRSIGVLTHRHSQLVVLDGPVPVLIQIWVLPSKIAHFNSPCTPKTPGGLAVPSGFSVRHSSVFR